MALSVETQFRVEWRKAERNTPERIGQNAHAAGAPSLRQCELDQVHRVTALQGCQQYLSLLSRPPG